MSVLADEFVTKQKTIYSQDERCDLLHAIKWVDEVILCNASGPQKILAELKPDVYVRGADYQGKEMPESAVLENLRIPVRYTTSCPPRTGEVIARILRSRK